MKHILDNWNIEYKNIANVQKNVWRIDEDYYLKANVNECFVRKLNICDLLREQGIPVPEVLDTKQGKAFYTHKGMHYYLTRKLEGVHIDKKEVMEDKDKARLVGRVIGKIHKAFSEITDKYDFYNNDFVNELNGWVKDNIEKYAKGSFTYSIFDDCVIELDKVYGKLKRHLIHRDMHLGNLLFTNNSIAGYIDFDLTQINVRIFDLAYFLVGWIVGEIHNDDFMAKWKITVETVIKGYEEEQKLSNEERDSIGIMMCCIEILFVAYFYGINDSENSLKSEECLKWLWDNREDIY